MKDNTSVESFNLNHNKVAAPYIRLCGIKEGEKDKIYKFDIRFCQPNKEFLPISALHSIEHMLANYLHNYSNNIIDISPMGCQTGFYLTTINLKDLNLIASTLEKALQDIINADSVIAANELQCGNFKTHDLNLAKKYSQNMLNKKQQWLEIFINENDPDNFLS